MYIYISLSLSEGRGMHSLLNSYHFAQPSSICFHYLIAKVPPTNPTSCSGLSIGNYPFADFLLVIPRMSDLHAYRPCNGFTSSFFPLTDNTLTST